MSDALNSYRDGSKRSCLVTGATGLVGNNVVRRFLDTGWNVKVLVRPRHSETTAALEGLPVQKIIGQLEDTSSLQRAVDGIDLVIHSAAMVHCGWRYYDEMYRVNVEGRLIFPRLHALPELDSFMSQVLMPSVCGQMVPPRMKKLLLEV